MEGIVGDRPCDLFEEHVSPLAMTDDRSFTRDLGNGCLPITARSAEGPEGSGKRDVGIRARRSEQLGVVRHDASGTGGGASEALRPDPQIVRHVTDVGAHRPREIGVTFAALCVGQQHRELPRNASQVREGLVESDRERKGALPARVAVQGASPSIHEGTITDLAIEDQQAWDVPRGARAAEPRGSGSYRAPTASTAGSCRGGGVSHDRAAEPNPSDAEAKPTSDNPYATA